jgi:DNA/RNA-binding domain of Phe-tRNA-synthetase-like protein
MSRTLSIADIAGRFPDFRVAAVVAETLAIPAERPPELDRLIAEREAAIRARYGGMELSAIPGVAAWRSAYRAFGIKRTSYRSSVERLVKNALAGRALPAINGFVDAYNAVSLTHVLCLGADDLDHVAGDLAFRVARPGDNFVDMGAEEGEDPNDPPKDGEIVYADAEKVLCRRWNWRQDARSVITPATRRAVVTVQSNGAGDLDAAVADLVALIERFCGGRSTVAVADATTPVVRIS